MVSEQRTLARTVSLRGIGLHTGAEVSVEIHPADPDAGVVFARADLPGEPTVAARRENIVERPRRTAIARGEAEVHTTEHLLSALWAAGVDNALVRIDGPEVPGLDGSALPFYEAIAAAGIRDLGVAARPITLDAPIAAQNGQASIVVLPRGDDEGGPDLKVLYTLDLGGLRMPSAQRVGTQFLELAIDEETWVNSIGSARTFVFEEEVEVLRAEGLGRGASTQNTLVMGADGLIENEFRFPDEFVRHKVLDLIGDLCLLGRRLRATVVAVRSGHALNAVLTGRIMAAVSGSERVTGRSSPAPRAPADSAPHPSSAATEARRREVMQVMASCEDGLGTQELETLLPHRYPFLLIDRVLEVERGSRAVGLKNVTYNEEFFRGHFPGRPVMPGVLQLEAMAQLACVLVRERPENATRTALFLSLDGAKFRRPVVPGDQLILEVWLERQRRNSIQVRTEARVDGQMACEARMRFMLVD